MFTITLENTLKVDTESCNILKPKCLSVYNS